MAKTSGRKGRPWRRAVEQVKQRSQICAACHEAIDLDLEFPDPMSFSVDHIIPLSQLGEHDPRRISPDNLQPMHLGCNARKGAGAVKPREEKLIPRTSRKWV